MITSDSGMQTFVIQFYDANKHVRTVVFVDIYMIIYTVYTCS